SVVHLSWSAPADGGAAITGYNVYRGTSAGGETMLTGLGNLTSFDDGAVTPGGRYYYRVTAVNTAGEGAQSNEVSATVAAQKPAVPALTVTADSALHPSCNAPATGAAATPA